MLGTKKGMLHIRLSMTLKQQLEAIAQQEECALSVLIRDVLREYVDTRAHTTD